MNYKLTTICAAVIIAMGVASLGAMIKGGILGFKDSERVVSVKGLAEQVVMADNVIWPISYSIMGNDLTVMYNDMEAKNADIISFMTKYNLKRDDISVALPDVEDLKANSWGNEKITERYKLTSTITLTTTDISSARAAMTKMPELMKKGIAISSSRYGSSAIRFDYNSLNSIKPEMIEQATQNARDAAEKFAKDSQSKLGKIKTANQGQFTITTPDANSPHKKLIRVVTTINYYLND